jgi:serine/threonine protein kinase
VGALTVELPAPIADLLASPEAERAIGPFVLERQLGRGGFAPVWLAKERFGGAELRPAAVKLFSLEARGLDADRASHASAAARHKDQVVREAQALCRVEHPNVVRFYSIAVDDARGLVGLAMEYVTGLSLDRKLEAGGRMAPADVMELGLAVASALAAVHQAGLVHRDVKPSNVVEANGVYKLIDFGIASADQRAHPPAKKREKRVVLDDLPFDVVGTKMSMLSQARTVEDGTGDASSLGFVTGTVGYIDPVVVATGAPADASSDLYGLGAMLYECLAGKVPASSAARAGTGLAGDVLDGRARPLPVATKAPATPEALARLVDALVSPERAARPASATDVAAELRRMIEAARTEMFRKALAQTRDDTALQNWGLIWIFHGVLNGVGFFATHVLLARGHMQPAPYVVLWTAVLGVNGIIMAVLKRATPRAGSFLERQFWSLWSTCVVAMGLAAIINYLMGLEVMLFMPSVASLAAAMTFSVMGGLIGRVWYVPAAVWAAMALAMAVVPHLQFALFAVLWALTQSGCGALLHRAKLRAAARR